MDGYQFDGDANATTDETFIAEQPEANKEFFEKFFATEVWFSFVEARKTHSNDLLEDFMRLRGAFLSSLLESILHLTFFFCSFLLGAAERRKLRREKLHAGSESAKQRTARQEREMEFLMGRFSSCTHQLIVPKPSLEHLSPQQEEAVRRLLCERHWDARVEQEVWKKRLQDWSNDRERAKAAQRQREKGTPFIPAILPGSPPIPSLKLSLDGKEPQFPIEVLLVLFTL